MSVLQNKPGIPRQSVNVAALTDATVTQTANAVTADGSVTIADGSTPSNDEIYELAIELAAKVVALNSAVNSILTCLKTYELMADS